MSKFQVGDRVVRATSRYHIAGVVVGVFASGRVRVSWDKSEAGFTRIGSGKGQSSTLRADGLVAESEFVARPLSKPTEDMPRKLMGFRVDMNWHTSGERVSEYGVNAFWFMDEHEARAKFYELCEDHPDTLITLKRQDKVTWVPQGCRKARDKHEWTELAASVPAVV